MTKKTRAVVSGAAGAAVLLASGATFALWSDSDAIGADAIHTGELALTVGEFAWRDMSSLVADGDGGLMENVEGGVALPDVFLMVPGDVVVGTVDVDDGRIERGTNLVAELRLPGLDGVAANGAHPTIEHLHTHVSYQDGVVTVELDWSRAIGDGRGSVATTDEDGMGATIAFDGDAQIVLQQVRPAG